MLTPDEERLLERRISDEDRLVETARSTRLGAADAPELLQGAGRQAASSSRPVSDLVRQPGLSLRDLLHAAHGADFGPADDDAWTSAEIELKYDGYLAREREAAGRLAELASFELPGDLPYSEILSLSTEARQKLTATRPSSLAQAGRIPGVSPSDLQNLVFEVVRRRSVAA
jgi:tRNA uridine 5-carboxymethylaminomethyl modification enzyme